MAMFGDLYRVHYNRFGSSETHESELGKFDKWPDAKAEQERIFISFPEHVRAAWIIRTNPGLKLKPQQAGFTMRRRVPQSQNKASV